MEKVKLSDLCKMQSGGTPSRSNSKFWENGKIPWSKISDLEKSNDGYIYETEEYITDDALKSINNRFFGKGTLLLAIYGSVGKIAITKIELSTNQAILGINIKDKNRLDIKYLKYWFTTIKDQLLNRAVGVALSNISLSIVKELEIPLPTLSTQQKIAKILDKADELRQYNQQLIEKYDALTQSLFLDMFGDPVKNNKKFSLRCLNDVASSRLGKMLDGKKIIGNNLKPYLRNSNVQWFRFQLDDLLQMDFDEKDKIEFSLKFGDILMCEGGEIGRCAIWKNEIEDCYFQKAIHRIRLNKEFLFPEYFVYMFKNISDNGGLDKYKSAATISHLTGQKLKQMIIPIPKLKLQNQFAERVQIIENQKQQAQESLEKSELLFQSLLQKAFNGGLN